MTNSDLLRQRRDNLQQEIKNLQLETLLIGEQIAALEVEEVTINQLPQLSYQEAVQLWKEKECNI